jgi:BirA family transcriptional regulator, biotin operon repressor / biotin---[acetyl-CoA-carboxylase] ligase
VNTPQPVPGEFSEPLTRAAARIKPLASRIFWYSEVTSTNDVAVHLAESGAEEGVLVLADGQTAGRGRRGRDWASPPAAGIYATVVLRPPRVVVPLMTIAAGVALADGIESATGLRVWLKWPNDIVIGDSRSAAHRKIGGILAEAGTARDGGGWVVLGFGINVLPGAYPPEVDARATSLEAELGKPVDRSSVLVECLAGLSGRYAQLRDSQASNVLDAWRRRAGSTLGRRVEWHRDGRTHLGLARDIDDSGALLVQTEGGLERVISGEVRWR